MRLKGPKIVAYALGCALIALMSFGARAQLPSGPECRLPEFDFNTRWANVDRVFEPLIVDLGRRCPSLFRAAPGFVPRTAWPAGVLKAAQSVFLIIATNDEIEKQTTQLRADLDQLRSLPVTFSNLMIPARALGQLWQKYLERCEVRQEPLCRVPNLLGLNRGSGFLFGNNGRRLWSSAHVAFKRRDSEIFIFDARGELVYNSLTDGPIARLQSNGNANYMRSFSADFTALELNRSLGADLKIAPRLTPGETVYALGYPTCTGCNISGDRIPIYLLADREGIATSLVEPQNVPSRAPFLDSDGRAIMVSHGPLLGALVGDYPAQMMIVRAFVHSGQSGGPAVNASGEVLGINTAGLFDNQIIDKKSRSGLLIIRPLSWTQDH